MNQFTPFSSIILCISASMFRVIILSVVDPGVPPVILPSNEKKLSVPVILDVKPHYFGSLGLVYYSYNQETYRFFRHLSSNCAIEKGRGPHKVGVVDEKFSRAAHKKNPLLLNILQPPLLVGICPLGWTSSIKGITAASRMLTYRVVSSSEDDYITCSTRRYPCPHLDLWRIFCLHLVSYWFRKVTKAR